MVIYISSPTCYTWHQCKLQTKPSGQGEVKAQPKNKHKLCQKNKHDKKNVDLGFTAHFKICTDKEAQQG